MGSGCRPLVVYADHNLLPLLYSLENLKGSVMAPSAFLPESLKNTHLVQYVESLGQG